MSQIYDSIIIGAGPSGLASSIYLARAKNSVLVLEKEKIGGQITITSEIVNYPGVLEDSGSGLTEKMRKQAENFGAKFKTAEVLSLELDDVVKKVITNLGTFEALSVVIATGANPRKLGFIGEKEFQGRGVAYCATCDGEFFTGANIFVIGGGFAACEEAIFLTQYAKKVTMIVREEDFTAARTIADKVLENKNIDVIFESEIKEVGGDGKLKYAKFINNKTNEEFSYSAKESGPFGVFVFAGYVPNNTLVKDKLLLTNGGYIVTDKNQKTSIDGVYASGDICDKNLRQVVTAVSDGAIAATSIEKYVHDLKESTKIETIAYENETKKNVSHSNDDSDGFLSGEIKEQLKEIYQNLTNDLTIVVSTKNDEFGFELENFAKEFVTTSSKLKYEVISGNENYLSLKTDRELNVKYYLVPGGHEFNSFVLLVYNAASKGQEIPTEVTEKIKALDENSLKVFVSLSCTMCPELVQSAQQIALKNNMIKLEVFDINRFKELKDKYQIMSVPCLVYGNEKISFGKKNITELIDIL